MAVSDIDVATRMVRTQKSASDRGKEFTMSFNRMKELLEATHCFITGVELETGSENKDNYLTLERLDNSKGYTDDNVVACSSYINKKKGDLSVEEIEKIYYALVNHGIVEVEYDVEVLQKLNECKKANKGLQEENLDLVEELETYKKKK